MAEFNIKILTPTDWLAYKSVRLASLADAPDSFGSTYEREAALFQSEWESRLDPTGRAKTALPLVAECGEDPVGIAWGLVRDADSKVAHVYQMGYPQTRVVKGSQRRFLIAS